MSKFEPLRFKISGTSPLLMHNGQLADPMSEHAKSIARITAKRRKVEADHRELARQEFLGGLYLSGGVPCIPAEMMEAALVKSAMHEKRGPAAKAGLFVPGNIRLDYDGPSDPHHLWEDPRFRFRCLVRVGTSRLIRTRPRFDNWACTLTIEYMPDLLNPREVTSFIVTAGTLVGIGDWRPKFGRFMAEPMEA